MTGVRRAGLIEASVAKARHELDLGLMFTSDHKWCVYSELSGVDIHQLVTEADGGDAVTTARFISDGHQLQQADPGDDSRSWRLDTHMINWSRARPATRSKDSAGTLQGRAGHGRARQTGPVSVGG